MESYLTFDQVRKAVIVYVQNKIKKGDLDIPVLPHVAQKVLNLVNNPDASVKDIQTIIEKDQHLSARLLRIANSPVYAGTVQITSIQRAVVTVGFRSLKELVFAIAMGEKVFRSKLFGEAMNRVWEHALATAVVARELAKVKGLDGEYGFMCGLLHDIGKAQLLNIMEEMNRKYKDRLYFTDPLVDEILKDFHPQVGSMMAGSWKFPAMLRGAIRYHHEYTENEKYMQMALLTNVADLFARKFGATSFANDAAINLLNEKALYDLNLYPEEIDKLIKTLPAQVRSSISQFS